jgi:hypothetical protein
MASWASYKEKGCHESNMHLTFDHYTKKMEQPHASKNSENNFTDYFGAVYLHLWLGVNYQLAF